MTDVGKTQRMGDTRKNYIDFAGHCFANAQSTIDYRKAVGFMDAFEATLEPGDAKRDLMQKKESIENEKQDSIRKWKQWVERLGFLEQGDAEIERLRIEIAGIEERLAACWDIAKRYGLFND